MLVGGSLVSAAGSVWTAGQRRDALPAERGWSCPAAGTGGSGMSMTWP